MEGTGTCCNDTMDKNVELIIEWKGLILPFFGLPVVLLIFKTHNNEDARRDTHDYIVIPYLVCSRDSFCPFVPSKA